MKKNPLSEKAKSATVAGVTLTHPDKVLYPEAGLTKKDLAHYYKSIAAWILPHLRDRPLTLVRCPQGREQECFYQKHANDISARHVNRITVQHDGEPATYMTVNSLPAIIDLVRLDVLELHTWGSRCDRLDRPDRMVFDLDPGTGVDWQQVIEAAKMIRDYLAAVTLVSFVKTTGGKGLHVVVPLLRRNTWAEVKSFSKIIAENMAQTMPERFTSSITKARRTGKIFVDYLRNDEEATAIAAYSPRARPGAPVSTPVSWGELNAVPGSDHYTLVTLLKRLKTLKKDPWNGFGAARQTLTRAMIDNLRL